MVMALVSYVVVRDTTKAENTTYVKKGVSGHLEVTYIIARNAWECLRCNSAHVPQVQSLFVSE